MISSGASFPSNMTKLYIWQSSSKLSEMFPINAEEINGKNFIGMWDIENDILLKNIIDFFNNNHERTLASSSSCIVEPMKNHNYNDIKNAAIKFNKLK